MRALPAALVACALAALPAALTAQPRPANPIVNPPAPPANPAHPITKPRPPHPRPSGGYRPNGYNNAYPYYPNVNVDASQYLATPNPHHTPSNTTKPPKPANGQEVFSTHSTNDALK